MICPNCGKENQDISKFCTGCGTSLLNIMSSEQEDTYRGADIEDEETMLMTDFENEKTEIMYDTESFENDETVILDDIQPVMNKPEEFIVDEFENEETVILDDVPDIESTVPNFDYRGNVPVFKEDVSGTNHDTAYIDHLRALKQLLDDGIITEDEFTRKKQQILGI